MARKRKVLLEQWAAIHVKLAIIVWAFMFMWRAPRGVAEELGWLLIYSTSIVSIIGSIVGIVGLLLTKSTNPERRQKGPVIEFSGLVMAVSGPVSYFIAILYLSIKVQVPQGYSGAAITYALCASMISRIIVIRRTFKEVT